jgi:hypothetical protein
MLAAYWSDQGLLVSKDLIEHEKFLLSFTPTGAIDPDLRKFLVGVRGQDFLDKCLAVEHDLTDLAVLCLQNDRVELALLADGERPLWTPRYQRWSKEQLAFYKHLLELEEAVLTAILGPTNAEQTASARSAQGLGSSPRSSW